MSSALTLIFIKSSKRGRKISDEWLFLDKLLKSPLPAVPTSKLISIDPAERLAFRFQGQEYTLPRLNGPPLFNEANQPKLHIHLFVKALLSDNQGGKKVVTNDVINEALKEFAIHGFPGSSMDLKKGYQKSVSTSLSEPTLPQ